jgi:hypothetical protein
MGTGGVSQQILDLRRDLHINEVKHDTSAYVELYNTGTSTIDLDEVYIAVAVNEGAGPDYVNVCDLSGHSIGASSILLTQKGSGSCYGGPSNCVKSCSYMIDEGSVVYILMADGPLEGSEEIDSVIYPSGAGTPSSAESYQASPNDGDETFVVKTNTVGIGN